MIKSPYLFIVFLLCLSTPVYAEIIITGADAIIDFGLSSVDIPTDKVPLDEIFISGEDAVNNYGLYNVVIPTNIIPLTDIFISGEDGVNGFGLSRVEVSTNKVPLEDIFISGHDAVNSYGLKDPWRGNASIVVDSYYDGQTVYTSSIIVRGTAFDESGIRSVKVNGVVAGAETWSANVSLDVGRNCVMIIVEDGEGYLTRKLFDVYVVKPFVFVHMTDVHIGYEPTEIRGEDKTNAFVQSVEKFADTLQAIKSENPEFILSPGDLVEYSKDDFFNAYMGILESINTTSVKIPVYNTPGNHDRRGWLPFNDVGLTNYYNLIMNPNNTVEINSYRDYYFNKYGYFFVGLDSGRDYSFIEYEPWTPEANGLNIIQMNNLMSMNPHIPKIVFTHHPILDMNNDTNDRSSNDGVENTCPQYGGNDACIANNRCEFINYSVHNNVDLVLTGHTHKDENISVFNENKTHKTQFIQTRSATKEEYGYRVINITEKGISHKTEITQEKLKGITRYTYWGYFYLDTTKSFSIYATKIEMWGIIPLKHNTGVLPDGTIKREISDSYFTGMIKNPVIVCYAKPDKIVVSLHENRTTIQANSVQTMDEEQLFTFGMKQQTESTSVKYIYENITLSDSENATVNIDLNETNIYHTMEIDYDGDGNVDNTTEPTFIIINNAPVSSIATPTGALIDNITIQYNLKDNQSDNCTIITQYSFDNSTWFIATHNESLFNITSNATGINHSLVWLSSTDVGDTYSNVFFRIKPHDGELFGEDTTTNAFFVGEEEEITIKITPENLQIFPPNTQYATVKITPNKTFNLTIDNLICKDNGSGCIPLNNPCEEISVVFNDTNNLTTATNSNGEVIIKITLGASAQRGIVYRYYVNETSNSVTARTMAIPEFSIIFLAIVMYLSLVKNNKRKLI